MLRLSTSFLLYLSLPLLFQPTPQPGLTKTIHRPQLALKPSCYNTALAVGSHSEAVTYNLPHRIPF